MANPIFSVSALNNPALRGQKISRLRRLQLKILFSAYSLKAIGGTNYTASLTKSGTGGLLYDAIQVLQNFDRDMVDEASAAVRLNNAVALGSDVPTNNDAWSPLISSLQQVSENDLNRMLVLLDCELGVAKAYPQ